MDNPYLGAFEKLQDEQTFRGQQWFGKRQHLVEEYSWAVPNEEVLTYLSEFDEIDEVGAGSGYWANCINEAGGNVNAYDIDPPDNTWTDVEESGVEDMDYNAFKKPTLLVWPALNKGVATYVAKQKPPHILYVGEPRGGCTAENSFFDIIEQEYGLVGRIELPSYVGVNDDFNHYVRKR